VDEKIMENNTGKLDSKEQWTAVSKFVDAVMTSKKEVEERRKKNEINDLDKG